MGDRNGDFSEAEPPRARSRLAVERHGDPSARISDEFHFGQSGAHAEARSNCLQNGLLCGEPAGKVLRRMLSTRAVMRLAAGESAIHETSSMVREKPRNPWDLDEIDADAGFHS